MTEYVVLLPGDEAEWERAPQAEKERMYPIHREFAQALEERGHKVTGGTELAHSREARVLRTTRRATTPSPTGRTPRPSSS
jgi:hypothetical protein